MDEKQKLSLPPVGAAFAVPLKNGRYSACRVIATHNDTYPGIRKDDAVLVAVCRWSGTQVPCAADPALRPILDLTHHGMCDSAIYWISEEPPPDLIPIGIIEPTAEEQAVSCFGMFDWYLLKMQSLLQWRWDHERESVLAADAIREKRRADALQQALQERQQYLERVTLEELKERQHFPTWGSRPPANATEAARKLMAKTIEDILALGPNSPEAGRIAVLQNCIDSFKELHTKLHIPCVFFEDFSEEFVPVVHASGLGHIQDLAEPWREW